MTRQSIVSIASSVLLGGLVLLVWDSRKSEDTSPGESLVGDPELDGNTDGLPSESTGPRSPEVPQDGVGTPTSVAGVPDDTTGEREQVESSNPGGIVTGPDGTPIVGAEVSWTPSDALEGAPAGERWDRLLAASLTATTDARGRFEFQRGDLPIESKQAVVWMTCPGWSEVAVEVDWSRGGRFDLLAIQPEARSACPISTVDDVTSEPVAGATVLVCGDLGVIADPYFASIQSDPLLSWAYPLLARSVVTDASGAAELPRWSGSARSVARSGELRSRRRHGVIDDPITYRLSSTYQLEVTLEFEGEFPEGDSLHLTLQQQLPQGPPSFQRIAQLEPTEEPQVLTLARSEGWSQAVTIGSLHTIPTDHPIGSPAPGDLIRIHARVRPSNRLELKVVDTEGNPIAGASLMGVYYDENNQGAASNSTWTDSDGRGSVTGLPAVSAWVQVQAEDYTSVTVGSYPAETLDNPDPQIHEVVLEPSGSLTGVVLHDGEPVETYHLSIWRGMDNAIRQPFIGTEDGSFELDGLPTGKLQLIVASKKHGLGPSPIQIVEVEQGANGPITVELSPSIEGHGRVVDGFTGEPIPGARIQPKLTAGYRSRGTFGENEDGGANSSPVLTDGQGEWRAPGFAQGRCNIKVTADGYPPSLGVAYLDGPGPLDFGTIPLYRGLNLRVQVTGLPPEQLAGLSVSCDGSQVAGPVRTDAQGLAILPDLQVGLYNVYVELADGGYALATRYLYAEDDAEITVDMAGESSVELRFVDTQGEPVPFTGTLQACARFDGPASSSLAYVIESQESFTFGSLEAGVVDFLAWDAAEVFQGITTASVQPGVATTATLRLTPTLASVRIVDRSDEPIPDVQVHAQCTERGSGASQSATTGPDGVVHLDLDPTRPHALRLRHPTHGEVAITDVDFPDDGSPGTVVMDGAGIVRVKLQSEGQPLTAVLASLEHPSFEGAYSLAAPDSQGRLTFRDVGPGPLQLTIRAPGYWPTSVPVESTPFNTAEQLIDVPRTTDIVVDLQGATLDEFETFNLQHTPSGDWASDWIDRSLVQSELSEGPATQVKFFGIPTGPYRWVAARPGEESVEGTFQLGVSASPQTVGIAP